MKSIDIRTSRAYEATISRHPAYRTDVYRRANYRDVVETVNNYTSAVRQVREYAEHTTTFRVIEEDGYEHPRVNTINVKRGKQRNSTI